MAEIYFGKGKKKIEEKKISITRKNLKYIRDGGSVITMPCDSSMLVRVCMEGSARDPGRNAVVLTEEEIDFLVATGYLRIMNGDCQILASFTLSDDERG